MSGSWAFVKYVAVALTTTGFCILAVGLTSPVAQAAPYPPTEPCSVTATARGVATAGGISEYDVVGSGLGPVQPVRVVLATTGRQVAATQTDSSGTFRTVVSAPLDTDTSSPDLTASSPQHTCTSSPLPPTPPTPSASGRPSNPASAPVGGGSTTNPGAGGAAGTGTTPGAGGSAGGSAGQGTDAGGSGGLPGDATPTARSSDTRTGSTPVSSATPNAVGTSVPPLGEPLPGTETPFGIGLGIAAVLLVLGSLAVLLLTRRPER